MYYQGNLCNLTIQSADMLMLDCHLQIIAAWSPFIRQLARECVTDSIILPDFNISEVSLLMNLLYTGRYQKINSRLMTSSSSIARF